MKAKNENPVCFNVRGRQWLVENTVNFVFGGFGVAAETYMLNFCYFRNTYTSKALYNFSKFLFMQRARDYRARKNSY